MRDHAVNQSLLPRLSPVLFPFFFSFFHYHVIFYILSRNFFKHYKLVANRARRVAPRLWHLPFQWCTAYGRHKGVRGYTICLRRLNWINISIIWCAAFLYDVYPQFFLTSKVLLKNFCRLCTPLTHGLFLFQMVDAYLLDGQRKFDKVERRFKSVEKHRHCLVAFRVYTHLQTDERRLKNYTAENVPRVHSGITQQLGPLDKVSH